MPTFCGGGLASDIALTCGTRQSVLAEPTCGLATTIQTRNYLTVQVHNLALGIDPQAGARVVNDRRRPCGIEWWIGDLVQRIGLAEVLVDPLIDRGIVPRNGCLEVYGGHGDPLIFSYDLFREIRECVGLKK